MNLYLIRHGDAVPVGGSIQHDADRVLSPQGREDALAMGATLAKAGAPVSAILTSPLTRAVETAELLAGKLPSNPRIIQSEHLTPGFGQRILLDQLNSLHHEGIIVIGHQPDMSSFLSYLVGDGETVVEMTTCAAALVRLSKPLNPHGGVLRWLLTPDLVRALNVP
jgi:phosphohistidine phosphatase